MCIIYSILRHGVEYMNAVNDELVADAAVASSSSSTGVSSSFSRNAL